MMAVDVVGQPAFVVGKPRTLFEGGYVRSEFPLTGFAYDVFPDGQRFLMIEETGGANSAPVVTVVSNWTEELTASCRRTDTALTTGTHDAWLEQIPLVAPQSRLTGTAATHPTHEIDTSIRRS